MEFWDFSEQRVARYTEGGVLWLTFLNEADLVAYLERHGYPDLFVNHGPRGQQALDLLEGRCFRVHVPALRLGRDRAGNVGADCYLVDAEEQLDERSMLYVPVVNTWRLVPGAYEKRRDLLYLAACYDGKRHDIVVDALRGTDLTCHFHPVEPDQLDLSGTLIETSSWDERDVVELLQTSRIAVYPADNASNPAAMWECVAADLPIVVNRGIRGGRHVVVPGVTGELAAEEEFGEVMRHVHARRDAYAPRRYLDEHWDTVATLESYLAFFARMGWDGERCS